MSTKLESPLSRMNRSSATSTVPLSGRKNSEHRIRTVALIFIMAAAVSIACLPMDGAADVSPSPDGVLRATLENGLRVVIVPHPLSPVVTTVVNYLVGSNESPEGFPGMAHAQEHMMFRGSRELSAGQLANITATMGGMFDASTEQNVTQYSFTVPSEDLEVALHIEAIRMQSVLDDDQLWNLERNAIKQEVAQDLSDPDYRLRMRLLEHLFDSTPYAHDALGTNESFDNTTGGMLKAFYDSWYKPNNAMLVIVGNVEPRSVLAKVKQLFGSIPAGSLPTRPEGHLLPVKAETLRQATDKPYGMVILGFRMPGYADPDYAATQVLADVLDNQRSSLHKLVYDGKALDADFSTETWSKTGLAYASAAFPRGANPQSTVKHLKNVLASFVKHGAPADLVEAAKLHRRADVEFEKNSISRLAMAWSRALAVEGRQSPKDDVIATDAVTVADVNRMARKYLDTGHAVVGILTPGSSGKPVASKRAGGKESFTPKQVPAVELPKWAEEPLHGLSIRPSRLDPVVSTLSNGIKLIVQPETASDTVLVYGRVKSSPELQVPRGKEGVNEILEGLFSFGTTSLGRDAIQKALDDIGASMTAGSDFSLQVLAEHFDRGTQLLADNEIHPLLPKWAFDGVRRQVAITAADLRQSPGYVADRAVKSALYPKDDPTLREVTPTAVSSLTVQDVKTYYRNAFRPDLTTIVVIGKVTPDQAKATIEKYFGDWEAPAEEKPETLLPPVPLNEPSTVAVPNGARVQDRLTLVETLGLTRSDPDYYALQLGNQVLSGPFYASRLYRDLREYGGLVYSVDSAFEVSQTRAHYVVECACDPLNVHKTRSIIEQNLNAMREAQVNPDELKRAKALLLREIPLSESSLDNIALGFLERTSLNLPLDEPTRAARRYLQLTAKDVNTAFSKWLRPECLIQVTEGPPPH